MSLSKSYMTGRQERTVRMIICSCNTFATSRPQSLSFHSLILTSKINIIRRPLESSKHDQRINSAEENVDWKEYLPDHYTKIALRMQPERFISHSVLALCTDISALMNKGL